MYVEKTNNQHQKPRFEIKDLTTEEMELLQSGLIEVKQHSLQDAEIFKIQRESCNEMFLKIDLELRNSR